MTNKHTQGKWHVNINDDQEPQTKVFSEALDFVLCEVDGEDLTEAEANARLIASAPCLLKALELMVENFNPPKKGFTTTKEFLQAEAYTQAQKALQQAKGE
jgi:hypothetical protein